MKICEAFRKAWEADNVRYPGRIKWHAECTAEQEARFVKRKPRSAERLHFDVWVENFHGFLSKSEVEKYGITREQIEEAHEAGFVREWERFNSYTRFGGGHSYGLQLTAKGKTALFKAFGSWIPQ